MKTLATYRVTFTRDEAHVVSVKFDESIRKVDGWLASKGERDESTDPTRLVLKDNRIARLQLEAGESESGRFRAYQISEPTKRGEFVTSMELAANEAFVELTCVLSEQGSPLTIQPMNNTARCPRVLRNIVGSNGDWRVGINPVLQTPIPVSGTADAEDLIKVMVAENRRVPVVAVSERDGAVFYPELAEHLARDLCGLAYVVSLDEEASWRLTKRLGREWSCYNQAIRVYWPSIRDLRSPERHPIWTPARLRKYDADERVAFRRLKDQLRKWLFELSTFAQSGISLSDQIRTEIRKAENQRAIHEQDWERLAVAYSEHNDELRKQIEELNSQKSNLGSELTETKVELTEIKSELRDVKRSFSELSELYNQTEINTGRFS